MAFRDELAAKLEARGWLPVHLAARLADEGVMVSTRTITNWLDGTCNPRLETYEAIQRVLEVEPAGREAMV